MSKKFYITTAIDYPSGPPHIGHVYEKVCADVIARWHRMVGDNVFFATGTDEHGQKIQRCAQAANELPEVFVNRLSKQFVDLWEKLNISYTSFIRTTENKHAEIVQTIFKIIYEKGDIYKGVYEGLYCIDCEAFYIEKDLRNGLCPVHNKKVEKIKEESYFFKLSRYQDKILKYIENNKHFIQPEAKRNEIINRIKEGIRDLSISRSNFNWGIPLPADERYVIFVWFDALLNYISVLDYPKEKFKKYWPADIHLIGKDILWFHTVVWLAILLACDIELPKKVLVHGFINIKGEKISKSKGIVIDPVELINKYGADGLRYFLLREIPFGEDGEFSEDALIKRINSDLANDLGNLLHRSLTMIEKYFQGIVPCRSENGPLDRPLVGQAKELPQKYCLEMENMEFSLALEAIWNLINAANKYIEQAKPWELFKEQNSKQLATLVYNLAEILRIVAVLIYPFVPAAAAKILEQLGLEIDLDKAAFLDLVKWAKMPSGTKVKKGQPLFPRII